MTYNAKSKTMSTRIDPAALDVLEWHARLTGVPLRKWLRDLLENRAAELSVEYDLDLTAGLPAPPSPESLAAVLAADAELPDLPSLDRREAFVARLSDALDMEPAAIDALVEDDNGILVATVDNVTFTDRPVTTTAESA